MAATVLTCAIDNIDTDFKEIIESVSMLSKIDTELTRLQNDGINILPDPDLIFRSCNIFNINDLKVVIIGQDPYPNREHANGLAFSVNPGVPVPGSLKNLYKKGVWEGVLTDIPNHGDLTEWANRGVLLLNTTLTVTEGDSNSHRKIWKGFCNEFIKKLCEQLTEPVCFLLMGKAAQKLASSVVNCNDITHSVVSIPHPSPLSIRYFREEDVTPFTDVNNALNEPIDWDSL